MAVLTNTMMQGTAAISDAEGDYQIEKSLRFNDPDTPYLTYNSTFKGNTRTWTWAGWMKRGQNTGADQIIFTASPDGSNMQTFKLTSADNLSFYQIVSGSFTQSYSWGDLVLRDHSAWYHLTVVYDSTESVDIDKLKLYINGKYYPSTANNAIGANEESLINDKPFYIGASPVGEGSQEFDGYLADVQFIDGLALTPAAFGSFDSTGVWNPKAFALPAPNNGTTWSTNLTGDAIDSTNVAGYAFNGILSNRLQSDASNATIHWGGSSDLGIKYNTSIRANVYFNGTFKVNDGNAVTCSGSAQNWVTLVDGESGTLNKLTVASNSGHKIDWRAIEVDGVILVDGQKDPTTRNNPNNGTEWKNASYNSGGDSGNYSKIFDGDNSDWMNLTNGNSPYTFTPPTGIPITSLRLYLENDTTYTVALNGGSAVSYPTPVLGYYDIDLADHSNITTLTSIALSSAAGGSGMAVRAIEINGQQLIDSSVDNSFHLKFNDTTTNAALGYDALGVDFTESHVEKGGPILKTNIAGNTVTSGSNTDANSSNLVFAWPGNNLTTDVSSSPHTLTNNGTVTSNTTNAKFYGSCGDFGAANEQKYISAPESADFDFGTGSWTIETWIRRDSDTANSANIMGVWQFESDGAGGTNEEWLALLYRDNIKKYQFYYGQDSTTNHAHIELPDLDSADTKINTWHHFAVSFKHDDTSNGTLRVFINGKLQGSVSDATTNSSSGNKQNGWGGSNKDLNLGIQEWNRNFAGQLQDFRIYKGVSKYNADFTVPTRNDFTVNNIDHDDGAVTVGSATGGKPIRQTTDNPNYGQTAHASNLNADSNDDELVLAIPFKNDQEYSAGTESGGSLWSGDYWYFVFEGNETNHIYSNDDNNPVRLTFPNPITVTGLITVFGSNGSNSAQAAGKDVCRFGYNDGSTSADIDLGSVLANAATWHTATGSDGWNTVEWIEIEKKSGGQGPILKSIKMDGDYLVDKYARDVSHTIRGSGSEKLMTLTSTNMVRNQSSAKYYGSCLDFAGSGANQDYIEAASTSTDFSFGTGAFTIECWYNWDGTNSNSSGDIFFGQPNPSSNAGNFIIYMGGSGAVFFRWGGNPNYTSIGSGYDSWPSFASRITGNKWHHIAFVRSGTGTDQTTMYIDGVSVGTCTIGGNLTGTAFSLGYWSGQSYINKGKMQDYRIYKGVAKYTSNFTPPVSPDPIQTDVLNESPTNYEEADGTLHGTFATFNASDTTNATSTGLGQGGYQLTNTDGNYRTAGLTIQPRTGKWYFEATLSNFDLTNGRPLIGFASSVKKPADRYKVNSAGNMLINFYGQGIQYSNSGTQSNVTAMSQCKNGDVLQLAIDYDAKKCWIGKNDVYIAADGGIDGNPATGANETFGSGQWIPEPAKINLWAGAYQCTLDLNTGQRPWSKTCPSGFKALCTQNLDDTFTGDYLNNPSKFFDIATWDGTGSAVTVKGLKFQPEVVVAKTRNHSVDPKWAHNVIGTGKYLEPTKNIDVEVDAQSITAFNSDGFTTGTSGDFTTSGRTYISWNWDIGTASRTPINTGGITPSEVWANRDAGFSATKYTGTGSDHSVPHDLGTKPEMYFVKKLSGAGEWRGWHIGLDSGKGIDLNNDGAQFSDDSFTQTVDNNYVYLEGTVGNVNASGDDYMLYAWVGIPGYSHFSLYQGSSDADTGNFVYTGFKPKFLMTKVFDGGTNRWNILDTTRSTFNPAKRFIWMNNADAEADEASNQIDLLSNGFKLRGTAAATNTNNYLYIYAAFAEHPQKLARAY